MIKSSGAPQKEAAAGASHVFLAYHLDYRSDSPSFPLAGSDFTAYRNPYSDSLEHIPKA